jgi:hypothetical protein
MSFKTVVMILVSAASLCAQVTSISGLVTDPSGAAIPAARVQATPSGGGVNATTVTNAQGVYLIPALTAADYLVRVDAAGFAPSERTVTLLVGQVLTLDMSVKPASVSSTVDVTAEAITVSTATSSVGGNIDPNQMKDLPLNGRNWMNLALLVPGVTSNDVDSNNPIGGVDGGKFQINVDGQQVTQNNSGSATGGQPRYSQDAIAEFQLITNRFDATQGRSLRAQINAETKTGTNTYHGTAFGYFRDNDFNAADPVAHSVLPYSDQQYGGTFGGKILKDKLWFFGSYEGERNPATIYATPTGFGGQTFTLPSLNNYREYLARFDYQRSDTSRISLRLNGFTYSNPFTGVSGTAHPSSATTSNNYAAAAVLNWSKIITPAVVNEVKLGFNYYMYKNEAIVNSQQYDLPTVNVGGPYNYPKQIAMETFSGRDDLFWNRGTHSIKTGGEYLSEFHHGYFPQNVRGVVSSFSATPPNLASIFPVWNDPSTWNIAALEPYANTFVQGFGNYNYSLQRNTIGFWIQDDWKILPRLILNLGLRYDDDIGMLSTSITPPDGLLVPRHGDNTNFGPRIGFAYDVKGDHKTVIRGGAGLYYGDIEANQFYDQALFNGVTTIQASVEAKPGVPLNLFAPFGSITGAEFLNGSVPAPQQALQLVDPNIQTPYTLQASGGFEHQLSQNWTVSADYVYWRIYHEWERIDQNLTYDPVTGFNLNPTTVGRPNPNFTTILRFVTPDASGAIYNGLQISVRRRLAKKWMLAGSYTLAKTKDSSGGAFYLPNNQFNLADEWGNGTNDQRNTLNINGAYTLPWGFQFSGAYHFGSGDDYGITSGSSPFANGGTNRTFLATAHVYDNPAWNYADAIDPKYELVQRNAFYGQPIHRVDVRLSKTFAIKERYKIIGIYEVFNVLNHANYGSYATSITTSSFTNPAQNTNLEYEPRMMQLAARFEF